MTKSMTEDEVRRQAHRVLGHLAEDLCDKGFSVSKTYK